MRLFKFSILCVLGASTLDPSKFIALRALVIIHILQALPVPRPATSRCVQASAESLTLTAQRHSQCYSHVSELSCGFNSKDFWFSLVCFVHALFAFYRAMHIMHSA